MTEGAFGYGVGIVAMWEPVVIQELFSLEGRVALVTGAAQGMGRAMALAFAEAGADLLIADIKADGLKRDRR